MKSDPARTRRLSSMLMHTTCIGLQRNHETSRSVRWTPHPVIVTIGDNRDYIRVLLYNTTITGWGVLLRDLILSNSTATAMNVSYNACCKNPATSHPPRPQKKACVVFICNHKSRKPGSHWPGLQHMKHLGVLCGSFFAKQSSPSLAFSTVN